MKNGSISGTGGSFQKTEELGQKVETASLGKDTVDNVSSISIGAARMHVALLPSF